LKLIFWKKTSDRPIVSLNTIHPHNIIFIDIIINRSLKKTLLNLSFVPNIGAHSDPPIPSLHTLFTYSGPFLTGRFYLWTAEPIDPQDFDKDGRLAIYIFDD
jgi:hypothetical protein